jgi:hypothetical protein
MEMVHLQKTKPRMNWLVQNQENERKIKPATPEAYQAQRRGASK